ncbi:F-box/FBD/LRR protein [Rhynchospora pubera]|uniref:F-box/FBD/LRR protein n=1 Tax=Rhynchospora pubera TaxID=906938 RepID=A0AAV8E1Y4_9POAL|nr:F-box/FBD/LRR protein [Rhynchospora pubera]
MQDIHIVERGNMDNPNKKQRSENDGLDIISNLPEEFKENILGRLPTDEAVRTILLSSQWRTTWMSVQELLFVCPITHSVENEIEILKINSRFNNLVDTALLMHNGAIRKVTLSISEGSYYCLDQWMQILANNGIQDLCIENQLMDYKYTLPPSFYACHSLRYVHLNMCIFLQLPLAFSEFNALHTLYLNIIHVSEDHITSMASQANTVSKTFGCLSRIKELHIHGRFFKFFGDKFTSTCNGLEILHLTMEIRDKKEIAAVLRILKSSPMLKELIIKIHQYDYYLRNNNTDVWNSQPKISLKHLEFAELWNYDESESTYAIVKLLMSSAPVLTNIYTKGSSGEALNRLLEKLSQSEEAELASVNVVSSSLVLTRVI